MMPVLNQYLREASQQLTSITITPEFEAELLMAYVLNQSRSDLHAWPERMIDDEVATQFMNCIQRRLHHEPIAYITEKKEFWSLDLIVNRHTLIPRPETELLIESLLEIIPRHKPIKIADLGTGSGAIALALATEYPAATIYAADLSRDALLVAKKNAARLGLTNIIFVESDWCRALPNKRFDVIVSNPPYIAENDWDQYAQGLYFEPKTALVSGADGLQAIRLICEQARDYLQANGYLMVEHGFDQAASVHEIFQQFGYNALNLKYDLSGQPRVTMGQFF